MAVVAVVHVVRILMVVSFCVFGLESCKSLAPHPAAGEVRVTGGASSSAFFSLFPSPPSYPLSDEST
jgi:hypothetical protein